MKYYLIIMMILVCAVVSDSCIVIKPYKNFSKADQSALFYQGYEPNADGRLNFDGYYFRYDESCGKFINGFGYVFYKNGVTRHVSLDLEYLNPSDATPENMKLLCDSGFIYWGNDAIYDIRQDTLLVDTYSESSYHYWEMSESKYQIIDRNTFKFISRKPKYSSADGSQQIVFRFIPAETLPYTEEGGLKERKWMWRSGKDRKAYKQELKAKKELHGDSVKPLFRGGSRTYKHDYYELF